MLDERTYACRSVSLRLGFALLLEYILMRFIGWSGDKIYYFCTGNVADEVMAGIIDAGIYLFSFMIPVALFRLISIGKKTEPMHLGVRFPPNALLWMGVGLGVTTTMSYVGNLFFSQLDFSVIYGEESLGSAPLTVVSFISTAVVPAVAEEFLFRGCVLSNLLPYGKQTAIFGSAILFALMHSNPIQFLYTFCAGLILGTVFVESGSIWPGMFLHLFNNFLSVILPVLTANADTFYEEVLYILFDAVFLMLAIVCFVVLLSRQKGKLLSEPTGESGGREAGIRGICSVTVLIFAGLCLLYALYILWITYQYNYYV